MVTRRYHRPVRTLEQYQGGRGVGEVLGFAGRRAVRLVAKVPAHGLSGFARRPGAVAQRNEVVIARLDRPGP